MKLRQLYQSSEMKVFLEYTGKLKRLMTKADSRLISESKITITIDDDEKKNGIPEKAKIKFIDDAKELGNFGNAEWVEQLQRGMKQAGVQGINKINEDDSPVSRSEIKKLIALLVNLIS